MVEMMFEFSPEYSGTTEKMGWTFIDVIAVLCFIQKTLRNVDEH